MQLFKVKFGSQVYGTATLTSDIDVGVVTLENTEQIYGIRDDDIIAQEIKDGLDTREVYLRRFCKLCAKGNPNVLEWLYTPKEHIEYEHPAFTDYIRNNASLFLVRPNLIASHLGFAKSQVMKMRNHEKVMGAKRKLLYEKYGYDVKYASHAIRLLKQLQDILIFGEIRFPYPYETVQLLKMIKEGKFSLKEFDIFYDEILKGTQNFINGEHFILQEKIPYDEIAMNLKCLYREIYG